MDFYLGNNPLLTDQERALGVVGLARVADQYAGPSFDCAKAATPTENSLCAAPVLRTHVHYLEDRLTAVTPRASAP
jgi:uncharacterized protein